VTPWQQWVERPQSLRVRKALATVHLWIGIAAGLYVVLISISGSALVFRRELSRKLSRRVVVVPQPFRMPLEALQKRVERAYPAYEVYAITESTQPDRPDQVVLGNGERRISRWFNPFTGADLGDPQSFAIRAFEWLADLHDNLLFGMSGRFVNGIGALFVTVLSLSGMALWWPGIRNWRRGLTINWRARFARFNWDLHSATGFWCSSFVFVWGLSGICLCFPAVLDPFLSRQGVFWITQLHFGRFHWLTEALWTGVGLAPALLAATGALMWWNRVLRKKLGRRRREVRRKDRLAAAQNQAVAVIQASRPR
jgi:uncharacterized iron-regulated membrane protein